MKKLLLLGASILTLTGIAQTKVNTTSLQYDALKKTGQLQAGKVYQFTNILSTQQSTSKYKGMTKTPSTICSCMVPLDSSFSIVPFNIGAPPEYRNDDGYTNAIGLPFSFNLYGVSYDSVFINNNGNISFNAPYSTFTANPFPDSTFNMIAPFWGDVDTRDTLSGLVYYKITPTAMIVKWENVGYYSMMSDKLNTFQLIITDGTDPILPAGTNVSFCYGDMAWTTGAASGGINGFGGTPATVGVNMGNGSDYFQVGRFDSAGVAFDGPYNNNDQVDWLDNQGMYFNTTIPGNVPPVVINNNICDTIDVYTGDTLHSPTYDIAHFSIGVTTPEIGQIVNATITCSNPSAFSMVQTANTPTYKQYDCSFSAIGLSPGTYYVYVSATDNGHPVLTTNRTIIIRTHYDATAPTGVNEQITSTGFSIYPNPANDLLNIEQSFSADDKPVLNIVDVLGKVVLKKELSARKSGIDISELPQGIYFVQVMNNQTTSHTIKLIKK